MDLITDTFIIFSCLMFWIVFHNKKGLLSEIKKTEKKISEKITVLEDLLDQHNLVLKKVQASVIDSKPIQESVLPAIDAEMNMPILSNEVLANASTLLDSELKIDNIAINQLNHEIGQELKSESSSALEAEVSFNSKTEYRVLGLPEDLLEDLEMSELEIPVVSKHISENNDIKKSENHDQYLTGVQNMVLEAKENLLKIDVSDVQEIRTFKDVVLMSKKIEMEKQQIKFKTN